MREQHLTHLSRVEQNRADTRQLIHKRLVQSQRRQQPIACKRIAIRQALRTVRNVSITLFSGAVLLWLAMFVKLLPKVEIHLGGLHGQSPIATSQPAMKQPAPITPVASPREPFGETNSDEPQLRLATELSVRPTPYPSH